MIERRERVLVHGPCLQDLTDLLYFDKIVYPVTTALIRPVDMQPGYVGYSAVEPVPETVRERLTDAGLITVPGSLIFVPPSEDDLVSALLKGGDALTQMAQSQGIAIGDILGEIFLGGTLDIPASEGEVEAWLQGLDDNARKLADHAVRLGQRAVPKLYAEDAHRTLKPGWDPVLSLRFDGMPCAGSGKPGVEDLIDFLDDEVTRTKRAALFDWHSGIEAEVQEGGATLDEIPGRVAALLEDYRDWLRQSRMFAGARPIECVMFFADWFVEGVVDAARQSGGNGPLLIEKRGLCLDETENREAGRELAYVAHTHRDWRSWFPMLM
jgi:hypothetical protein